MTDYETKSLRQLTEINQKLGLLLAASGIEIPTPPPRQPMKISPSMLHSASAKRSPNGWMG